MVRSIGIDGDRIFGLQIGAQSRSWRSWSGAWSTRALSSTRPSFSPIDGCGWPVVFPMLSEIRIASAQQSPLRSLLKWCFWNRNLDVFGETWRDGKTPRSWGWKWRNGLIIDLHGKYMQLWYPGCQLSCGSSRVGRDWASSWAAEQRLVGPSRWDWAKQPHQRKTYRREGQPSNLSTGNLWKLVWLTQFRDFFP